MPVDPSPWQCPNCFNSNAGVRPVCDWCRDPKTILEEERVKNIKCSECGHDADQHKPKGCEEKQYHGDKITFCGCLIMEYLKNE